MRFLTYDPYSYSGVQRLRKEKNTDYTPTTQQIVENPTTNFIGKFLGLETKDSWNKYGDKVYELVQWAEEKKKSSTVENVIEFLKEKLNTSPSLHENRIMDLVITMKMDGVEKKEQDFNGNKKDNAGTPE